MISLYNAMGIILRGKKSIIYLKLTFQEIPHTRFGVLKGGFRGFGYPNDTQMPCWLRPCIHVYTHQAWGQLLVKVIYYNYNYFALALLQLRLQLLSRIIITITITFLNVIYYNYFFNRG